MYKYLIECIAIGVMLLFNCTTDPITGTEVENERFVARVVNPDGSAAANATVTVLPVTFIPNETGLAKSKLTSTRKTTDADGYFSISDIEQGCYNFYAEKGELASYTDSVYISADGIDENEFILDSTGTFYGKIRVQPNHDPRIVEVQILGTHLYMNVDSNGVFSFPQIAPGEYRLRCIANWNGYVATYTTVQVTNPAVDTTFISILYTGIPVVENIQAKYDTVSQHPVLTWNKTSYRDLYEYVIYRDIDGLIEPVTRPTAVTSDTFFIDSTIWIQPEPPLYRYRVAIRTNSMELGPTYGFCLATVPGVDLHLDVSANVDSLHMGDTIVVTLHAHSTPFPLSEVAWYVMSDSTLSYDSTFSQTELITDFYDTLSFKVTTYPLLYFISYARNNNNQWLVSDSLLIRVLADSNDTINNISETGTHPDRSDTVITGGDTMIFYTDTTALNIPQMDATSVGYSFLKQNSTDIVIRNTRLWRNVPLLHQKRRMKIT